MNTKELIEEILRLKKERNAVILAHYYQHEDIQKLADFVGDSYSLSLEASRTSADVIVFCGVHFMAETAKLLNPERKVLLPDLNAGCSLAESCEYHDFKQFKERYPDHIVITYINCSADIKTLSDIVCTSSNTERIIRSIPQSQPIIFAPDKNLGKYLERVTGRKMVLWDGACVVHEAFSMDKLIQLKLKYPSAELIAHPESEEDILELADYIGSTSGMINYVKNSSSKTFIVATEVGILHKMKLLAPDKELIPAPSVVDNTCSCSECAYMKVNTLDKLYNCLKNGYPEIHLSPELLEKAVIPLRKMIQLTEEDGKV